MTLQEVARRARVSTATVSRVLNNGASVKSSTRARVLRVIQELKYSPNVHAQSLAGGRSRSIGRSAAIPRRRNQGRSWTVRAPRSGRSPK